MNTSNGFPWLLALGLALILGGGGYVVYTGTRGLRNNNPGNIEYDGTAWQGLANPPSDGTFCVFTDPIYGIRAIAVTLNTYVNTDGVPSNVTDIIERWSQTDQAAYIQNVNQALGNPPGVYPDPVNLATQMPLIVAAIITQENGIQPYSASTIAQGIALAA